VRVGRKRNVSGGPTCAGNTKEKNKRVHACAGRFGDGRRGEKKKEKGVRHLLSCISPWRKEKDEKTLAAFGGKRKSKTCGKGRKGGKRVRPPHTAHVSVCREGETGPPLSHRRWGGREKKGRAPGRGSPSLVQAEEKGEKS